MAAEPMHRVRSWYDPNIGNTGFWRAGNPPTNVQGASHAGYLARPAYACRPFHFLSSRVVVDHWLSNSPTPLSTSTRLVSFVRVLSTGSTAGFLVKFQTLVTSRIVEIISTPFHLRPTESGFVCRTQGPSVTQCSGPW
jgi:hypothetical protein